MDYDSLLELVQKRRSIRRFKPDPVPDEYVDKIIEVARWAPSGFNMQPWEFVVVKKPELKEKIIQWIGAYWQNSKDMETTREPWQGKPWKLRGIDDMGMDYTTAPVYIILFGDTRTKAGLPMAVRYDPVRCQLIYTAGLASAFLYMHLAATAFGLASQWVSSIQTPYVHCMVKDLLNIPPEMEVYDMMALGYPAIKPRSKFMRDTKKMIHYDVSGDEDFRNDEEVRDFVKRCRNWNVGTHRRVSE